MGLSCQRCKIVRGGLQLEVEDSKFCQIASGCLHNEAKRMMVGGEKNWKKRMVSFVISENDIPPQSRKQQEPERIGRRK